MVEFFAKNRQLFGTEKKIYLLPVLFTTATIWASEVDLSSAEIRTGTVDLETTKFSKQDWLLYRYNTSPGLKHAHSPDAGLSSLQEILESTYMRSIPIVSAEGISSFLDWSSSIDLSWAE